MMGMDNAPPAPPMMGMDNAPPAPPMMGMGNAPPPPPMMGVGNAPPLMGGLGGVASNSGLASLPPKPVIKPSCKLKKLNWGKIPNNKIMDTIWKEAKTEIEFDAKDLEETFGVKEIVKASPSESSGPPKKANRVTLFDGKRSNHINISLAKVKCDPCVIKKAIIGLEDTILDAGQVASLLGFLPTSEELQQVKDYQEDPTQLDKPEQFVYEVSGIEFLRDRVEFWNGLREFEPRIRELLPQIETVTKCFKKVVDSEDFFNILQVILALGNYLNGGSFNGRAYGFNLETLLKLVDTKSSINPKENFLDYVIDFVQKKFPDSVHFYKEFFPLLEKGKTIPETNIKEDSGFLTKQISHAKKLFEKVKQQDPIAEDNVQLLMRLEKFIEQSEEKQSATSWQKCINLSKTFQKNLAKIPPNSNSKTFSESSEDSPNNGMT